MVRQVYEERLVPDLRLSKLKQRPHGWHRLQSPPSVPPPMTAFAHMWFCLCIWVTGAGLGGGGEFIVGVRSQQWGMPFSHNAMLVAKSEGVVVSCRKTQTLTVIPAAAHMTEPPRGLFYLPIICFWTGNRFVFFLFYFRNCYLIAFQACLSYVQSKQ